jgi:hypothetical protein
MITVYRLAWTDLYPSLKDVEGSSKPRIFENKSIARRCVLAV